MNKSVISLCMVGALLLGLSGCWKKKKHTHKDTMTSAALELDAAARTSFDGTSFDELSDAELEDQLLAELEGLNLTDEDVEELNNLFADMSDDDIERELQALEEELAIAEQAEFALADQDDDDEYYDDVRVEEEQFTPISFALNSDAADSEELEANVDPAREAIENGLTVVVQGHGCQLGSHDYTRKLSAQRAEAVKGYLVERGLPADKIEVAAFGSDLPIVYTEEEDREQAVEALAPNRRVELVAVAA